jgi:hypothetical protein
VVGHGCGCGDLDFCSDMHPVDGLRFVGGLEVAGTPNCCGLPAWGVVW